MNALRVLVSVALGLMFVWAGVSKLAQGKEWSIASTPFFTGRTMIDAAVKWSLPQAGHATRPVTRTKAARPPR
ncbi:MAG: hypothetical protein NWP73_05165, partial [Ilumatobacteraceae bacterium]|nr:hypothetical protein [Ilumatobacteraceae bacterium]